MNTLLFRNTSIKRNYSNHQRNRILSISIQHNIASITQFHKRLNTISTLTNLSQCIPYTSIVSNNYKSNHNNNNNNNNSNSNKHNHYHNHYHTKFNLNDNISYIILSLAGLATSICINNKLNKWKNISACGIIGVVGDREECVEYLLDGLLILQNRGYDSAGVATISETNNICVTKHASKGTTSDSLDLLKREAPKNHLDHTVGLAHTRWATHGAKTDENAHPHVDYKNRLAIVHNGTIENAEPIKRELEKLGVKFESQTDTEVIVNLVSYYLDQIDKKTNKLYSIEAALQLALSQMEGSWGLAMISKDRPNEIFAARNGSPLMIGLDPKQNRNFIASEHTAFARFTNEFIALDDGEIAVISGDKVRLDSSRVDSSRIEKVDTDSQELPNDMILGGKNNPVIAFSPSPYKHWTLKEMMEQPAAVSRALGYGSRLGFGDDVKLGGLDKYKDTLINVENLVMTGCGTSYHAALYGQRLMQFLNSFETVSVVDSAEVISDTFPSNASGCLAISQSGETKDVINALNTAEMLGLPRFSVVNAVGSMIARITGCGVYAYAGREHAVASTKAFLSQATVLALIACWFSQEKLSNKLDKTQSKSQINTEKETTLVTSNKSIFDPNRFRNLEDKSKKGSKMVSVDVQRRDALVNALHKLPTYCGLTLDHTRDVCKNIAKELYEQDVKHMFVLGKGYAEPIAYEGALKIKEITYVHCEGFSGGALKHGPFALIENGTPIVMIILDDNHAKTMLTNAHEIESRGGKCIFITDSSELIEASGLDTSRVIKIPRNSVLTALLAVIPLQYIAYELAVLKGHNPDKPKNLAKAVTVD